MKITVGDICNCLEKFAPLQLQESYDNSGLIIGHRDETVNKVLISLDITENIVNEALSNKCNLIISHHPILFSGLKKITGKNSAERILLKSIRNNISIYAIHTNLDNIIEGVNGFISNKLGLKNQKILKPKKDLLRKLVTFCPEDKANEVREVLFNSGAGHIGNYDCCSFNTVGKGTFRAVEGSNPYVGEINKLHIENEVRIEVIFPTYHETRLVHDLKKAHPYEEVAYDIYPLNNKFENVGSGIIGVLEEAEDELQFLQKLKKITSAGSVRYSKLKGKKIKKVAICGGSGSFLINNAIAKGADIFITGDIKYHQFFDADNKIIIADIGHYESEQFAKEIIYNVLIKKIPNFAVQISKLNTNPINYL